MASADELTAHGRASDGRTERAGAARDRTARCGCTCDRASWNLRLTSRRQPRPQKHHQPCVQAKKKRRQYVFVALPHGHHGTPVTLGCQAKKGAAYQPKEVKAGTQPKEVPMANPHRITWCALGRQVHHADPLYKTLIYWRFPLTTASGALEP